MVKLFLIEWWEFIIIGFLGLNLIIQKIEKIKGRSDVLTWIWQFLTWIVSLVRQIITMLFSATPGKLPMLLLGLFLLIPGLVFASANVTLEWDGNSESDLAGYRVYQSSQSGNYTYGPSSSNLVGDIARGPNPGGKEEITIQVEDGTWFWVITAYDNEVPSLESGPSEEVTKKISSPPAPPTGFWAKLVQIITWLLNLIKHWFV